LDANDALAVSGKTGAGVPELLEEIVHKLPAPNGDETAPSRALLVDSWYDSYLGVVILVRVVDGKLSRGQKIRFMATGAEYVVDKIGFFTPKMENCDVLNTGEIGFIITGMKTIHDCKVGDTICDARATVDALPGFKPSVPVVFSSFFPVTADDYPALRESAEKLALNDASFMFTTEKSSALGFGLRCGFLGLLHMEIISERLSREFNLNLINTVPSVLYKIHLRNGEVVDLENPADMPDVTKIDYVEEPWVRATIMMPDKYMGGIMSLCSERRGVQENISYVGNRAVLVYQLPLSEIVFDFYDRVKSISSGYASFDYEIIGYKSSDLVKLDILLNGEMVDALSIIVHKDFAYHRGRQIVENLRKLIPRQLFEVPIQACIGNKAIARETVKAMRKDVLAKCYGGDVSRKRKLLEKQKEGKKRMKMVGSVEIPQEAFLSVLKMDGTNE